MCMLSSGTSQLLSIITVRPSTLSQRWETRNLWGSLMVTKGCELADNILGRGSFYKKTFWFFLQVVYESLQQMAGTMWFVFKKHFFQCNNFGSMTSSNQIATEVLASGCRKKKKTETVVHFAISLFHDLQWQWIDLKTASMIGGYRWLIPMYAHVWPKI